VNRTQFLVISTVVLLLFAVIYHIWAGWGLITIHAKQETLGKVIASMERQGHVKIETDLSTDTPVTMDVVKVHINDALEVLSTNTDSRWRLLYFVAGDKATLKTGEDAWFSGQKPTDWKMVSFPLGNMIQLDPEDDADAAAPDPRGDTWNPKTPAPHPVQDFFTEAAQATDAGFAFPTDWNPTVNTAPPAGVVQHVIPKLVSAASGHEDELFFLSQNGRGGGGPRPAGGGDGGGGPGFGNMNFDPDLFAARVQDQINRLPPEERTEAQSNFDAEKAFRASLQNMTDDQRRAAWMAHMQDPAVQAAMANRMDGRDAQMNHDQRMQHYSNYVNRKMAITGKM
jgi:hypothetical protein